MRVGCAARGAAVLGRPTMLTGNWRCYSDRRIVKTARNLRPPAQPRVSCVGAASFAGPHPGTVVHTAPVSPRAGRFCAGGKLSTRA